MIAWLCVKHHPCLCIFLTPCFLPLLPPPFLQGNYITDNTTPANRSQYTGVFWSQLQSSLLIGNTMLYLIVHGGDTVPRETALRFYRILLGVAGGGTLLFLLATIAQIWVNA